MIKAKLIKRNSKDSEINIKSKDSSNEDQSLELTDVFDQKYELQGKIGEGANGVVHRAVKKRTGDIYAVKCFKIEDEHLYEVKSTFQILRSLNHDGIVKY